MDWLDDQELIDITRRRQGAAQRRVLERWGVFYVVRPDGSPLVLRKTLEHVMGGRHHDQTERPATGLKWSRAA